MAASNSFLPSQADYEARIDRAKAAMNEKGVDVLALAGADILRFFTGLHGLPVTRPIWLILTQNGLLGFVSPSSEVKEIGARCNTPVVSHWVDGQTHQRALGEYLTKIAPEANKIGIDYSGINGTNLVLVWDELGSERVTDVAPMLRDHLLAVKDQAGLTVIRLSCQAVAETFKASRDASMPGVPEWKVTLASFVAGTEKTAEIWSGNEEQSPLYHGLHMTGSGPERTARCHAAGAGRIIEDGDIVQICRCSTGVFGHLICFDRPIKAGKKELSPELRKIIDCAHEAQKAAIAAIRPGVTGHDVEAAAMEVIERGGFKNATLHRTGRALGYSGWDGHELKAGSTHMLRAGEVYSIEPGIYVDGVGGARFGDTGLVTEDGCEVLTDFELGRKIW
ncbi:MULTISPECIES: Xaa-Pro peptidase family protein [unclassified Neorhizobium]|uniref:M24 family metallopeptidase n=1 Tax=unclassified Neorhizobium TaxID=2629175 RepID=UPI001FF32A06|nr:MULTISPECIES: Xaa-Pro peptidase family protein [unclassified Neorhizobium]MCJ9670388.1 Xaa-Pro peptidase family protein [Neorhizobium sp. SHOUNA12B]MCJ9746299.1 Xaa-Pro peptidase family protein [Neorhizobium sp. SHOUNA12A]